VLSMETLHLGLLVLHFLGLAALVGPVLIQRPRAGRSGLRVMLTGSVVQVLTGNGLIAANQLQGMHVIEAKMIVKLSLAVVSLLLLVVALWRGRGTPDGQYRHAASLQTAAGGLGVAALMVAVIWT
jgi:hypothetical protein